jgi:DNA (cytosine-5)-methyltransferase 1
MGTRLDERPTHLDLFSGIGGFALAARWAGFRTVGFCDIEPYAQRVLAKNFGAKRDASIPRTPAELAREIVADATELFSESGKRSSACRIITDIRTLSGTDFAGVSLVTGGFPCQPFSCAGKRRGTADDRHLWPEMLRVIAEARPAWVLGENVAGIINMELDAVLSDLEGIGYACRPFVIPACGVDARHRRNRVWIVAHRDEQGSQERRESQLLEQLSPAQRNGSHSHANGARKSSGRNNRGVGRQREPLPRRGNDDPSRWLPEPDVGRVAHGIPARVDRLRGLGNAIVPQVALPILCGIRAQIRKQKAESR